MNPELIDSGDIDTWTGVRVFSQEEYEPRGVGLWAIEHTVKYYRRSYSVGRGEYGTPQAPIAVPNYYVSDFDKTLDSDCVVLGTEAYRREELNKRGFFHQMQRSPRTIHVMPASAVILCLPRHSHIAESSYFPVAMLQAVVAPPEDVPAIVTGHCKKFCESHGLISDLTKCLSQAKVIFSSIQNLSAEYECFPADEYEEEGHIVIKLEVDSNQDTVFSEYDAFVDWMSDHIDDQAIDLFILSVNRTE